MMQPASNFSLICPTYFMIDFMFDARVLCQLEKVRYKDSYILWINIYRYIYELTEGKNHHVNDNCNMVNALLNDNNNNK